MTIHTPFSPPESCSQSAPFSLYQHDLIEEIKEYKRQTEHLGRVYDLHRRLGETLDLHALIEAFSIWLTPTLSHALLAYRSFDRVHVSTACSCHGDPRDELMAAAKALLAEPVAWVCHGRVERCHLFYHLWPLNADHPGSLLLFHDRPRKQVEYAFQLLEGVLPDLHGPLLRTLAYEALYHQARRDALTGLVNRRVFEERIVQEMANAERYDRPLVLACLDLDHFKAINDTLGHAEGDLALQTVSRTFSEIVRDSDLLARMGGDEFAMILPNTTLENAQNLMSRLCHAVVRLDIRAPGSAPLGVSIGVAVWQTGISFKTFWDQADAALYRAKSSGRSRVVH